MCNICLQRMYWARLKVAFPGTPEARLAAGTGEISQFLFEGLLRMLRVFDRVEPSGGSRIAPSSVLPSA